MRREEDAAALMRQMAQGALEGHFESIPGTKPERLGVYHELVTNGVEGALEKAYPIARLALTNQIVEGGTAWEAMLSAFVRSDLLASPYLWKMPRGLLELAERERLDERFAMPYLTDLLRFEWEEIEVYMMPDRIAAPHREHGSIESDALVVNPEARVLELSYPVYRPDFWPCDQGQFPLLLLRHPETGAVRFVEVSPVLAAACHLLLETPMTARGVVERILGEVEIPEEARSSVVERTAAQLVPALHELRKEGFILGYA